MHRAKKWALKNNMVHILFYNTVVTTRSTTCPPAQFFFSFLSFFFFFFIRRRPTYTVWRSTRCQFHLLLVKLRFYYTRLSFYYRVPVAVILHYICPFSSIPRTAQARCGFVCVWCISTSVLYNNYGVFVRVQWRV